MATRENSLWKWLRKILKDATYKNVLAMSRIENSVGLGTPDVEGVFMKKAFWIELKQAELPVRETTPIRPKKFTDEQVHWLSKRWFLGTPTHVFIQIGTERFLIPGYKAKQVQFGQTLSWYRKNSKVPGDCTPLMVLTAAAEC